MGIATIEVFRSIIRRSRASRDHGGRQDCHDTKSKYEQSLQDRNNLFHAPPLGGHAIRWDPCAAGLMANCRQPTHDQRSQGDIQQAATENVPRKCVPLGT